MTLHRSAAPDFGNRQEVRGTGPQSYDDQIAPQPHGSGGLRKLLLAMAGLGLAFLVVTHSLIAYLAETSPSAALIISPRDPVALVNFTERTLSRPKPAAVIPARDADGRDGTSTLPDQSAFPQEKAIVIPARPGSNGIVPELEPAEVAELRERVERALAADPMSARSIRILGQLVDHEGDAARATGLLEAAVRRSKHESLAVFFMVRRSIDAQNWEAAMFYADVLMRSRNDLVQSVTPMVVRLAETPAANALVKKFLIARPIWRPAFMAMMTNSITDARTPLDILVALKDGGSPPTREEIANYINFLIANQFHDIAYYAWLQFLPPEQMAVAGFVFNSGFELPLSGMPFDWTLPRPLEATVEVARVPGEDGNRALRIEFGSGRVQLGAIQQRLLLGIGSYRLTGRFRGEVGGRRGMRLTVSCATKSNAKIAETPMFNGRQQDWREFDVAFSVPEDCTSQMLRVVHDARFSAEQFVSGLIWYDDIRIARDGN